MFLVSLSITALWRFAPTTWPLHSYDHPPGTDCVHVRIASFADLAALLKSHGDSYSDLNGIDLVREKVSTVRKLLSLVRHQLIRNAAIRLGLSPRSDGRRVSTWLRVQFDGRGQ